MAKPTQVASPNPAIGHANQFISLIVFAPEQVGHRLRHLPIRAQVKMWTRWHPGTAHTTTANAKSVLRLLAPRYQSLDTEITELDVEIRRLCQKVNSALLAARGVGPDNAAASNATSHAKSTDSSKPPPTP